MESWTFVLTRPSAVEQHVRTVQAACLYLLSTYLPMQGEVAIAVKTLAASMQDVVRSKGRCWSFSMCRMLSSGHREALITWWSLEQYYSEAFGSDEQRNTNKGIINAYLC